MSFMNWLLNAISAQLFTPITSGALVNGSVLIASILLSAQSFSPKFQLDAKKGNEKRREGKKITYFLNEMLEFKIIFVCVQIDTAERLLMRTNQEKKRVLKKSKEK